MWVLAGSVLQDPSRCVHGSKGLRVGVAWVVVSGRCGRGGHYAEQKGVGQGVPNKKIVALPAPPFGPPSPSSIHSFHFPPLFPLRPGQENPSKSEMTVLTVLAVRKTKRRLATAPKPETAVEMTVFFDGFDGYLHIKTKLN